MLLHALVISLSSGRRWINLSPVVERTNALTNGVVDRPWVVGREFDEEKRISSCQESEKYFWIPRNWNHVLVTR